MPKEKRMTDDSVLSSCVRRRTFLKAVSALGIGAVGTGLLSACTSATPSPAATAAPKAAATAGATQAPVSGGKKITGKIGVLGAETHLDSKFTNYWVDLVKKRTNGDVDLQVFLNSQLGSEKEVCEGMILGSVQGQITMTFATLGNWVPDGALYELPFIFRDISHARKATNGPVGQEMIEKHTPKGFRILGFRINGIRNMISKFPITSLADVKGKKMRVMQTPLHISLWQTVGAIPTPMAFGEIYLALQTGVIDMLDNVKTTYFDSKFYEVAPHFTELEHIYATSSFTLSEMFWKQLNADQQKILATAAVESIAWHDEQFAKAEDDAMNASIAKGAKFAKIDKKPWIDMMSPIWDEWAPKVGGKATIQKIVDTK
jgi:TRAP-type transport system periplasmic protein